jgi:hypothetical protein
LLPRDAELMRWRILALLQAVVGVVILIREVSSWIR